MDSVGVMLAEYERRRKRVLDGLRAIPGITCATPRGAFYVFPDVRAALRRGGSKNPDDTFSVAAQLLEEQYVAVVPGEAFGAPGYIRISYATPLERIEEGLRRLTQFFAETAAAS